MENIILIDSKGNTILKKLIKVDGSESKTFTFKTIHAQFKVGNTSEGNKYILPYRGNIIEENTILKGTSYLVKSIDYIDNYGYTITFY